MALTPFDRETLLDLTVNVIPLGILGFFVLAFLVFNPFGWDSVISTLQFAIVISMFVLLTILTYFAGRAISTAEHEMEGSRTDVSSAATAEGDGADESEAAEGSETAEDA